MDKQRKVIMVTKHALVKDYMNPYVLSVAPEVPVADALMIMKKNNIRRLLVVSQEKLLGIITLSDIREAEPSDAFLLNSGVQNKLLALIPIQKIMTLDPITVNLDATIGEAALVMLERKIGGLPVVDQNEKVVGIITESDIFRLVVQHWKQVD